MPYQADNVAAAPALARWARDLRRSALQVMLAEASRPGVLSFALGLPAPELFPAADFARSVEHVLAADPGALQYGPPSGRLKRQVVELMARRGVACREGQVFLTSGAQQGISILTRLLLDPGGAALTEEMAYTGLQQVLEPFRPEIITVPTDRATGIDVDGVEKVLAGGARPAFIYAISSGHNPLSVSMSLDKRRRLAGLAGRYGVPVVEDDPYGFLCYEEAPPPPIKVFDAEWVFYVGSFSKILAPALRVGWLVVPEELIPPLSIIKESCDIDTSTLAQRAVSHYLGEGHLAPHLERLRGEYRARRDAMLRALGEHFPAGARWGVPDSGIFIWVEMPGATDTVALLRQALERERVAFIPGRAFSVGGREAARNCLRLNFSNCPPAVIEEGIARLGRVFSGPAAGPAPRGRTL